MNARLAFGIGALALVIAIASGLYLFVANSKTKTTSNSSVTQPEGVFSETYVPHGWKVVGNPTTAATVMAFTSPDYLLEWENPATVDCKGEGCVQQVLVKGASFALAYRPCGRGETEAEFRQREQRNITTLKGLVDQKPISIKGHKAVLVHTRNRTNTTNPVLEDAYSFTLFSAPQRGYCQDVNFNFVESTTTDYGTEFQKFIDGLQFIPDKSPQQ